MPMLGELFLEPWEDQAVCAGEELLRWEPGALVVYQPALPPCAMDKPSASWLSPDHGPLSAQLGITALANALPAFPATVCSISSG